MTLMNAFSKLPRPVKVPLHWLRFTGYRLHHAITSTSNPYGLYWGRYPAAKMKEHLIDVLTKTHRMDTPWHCPLQYDVLVEHSCNDGTHYSPMLREFAKKRLIGVDINPTAKNVDDYWQVTKTIESEYFAHVPSESIDAVFVIASVGFEPKDSWETYWKKDNSRVGRYFTPSNYPRILKPGGVVVVMEWEAWPHRREVNTGWPELAGFNRILFGYQPTGPCAVFKKP